MKGIAIAAPALRRRNQLILMLVRNFAKENIWIPDPKPDGSISKAQEHFDDFYATVFGKKWPSLRLGLLTEAKYIALPNAFLNDTSNAVEELQKLGAFDLKELWTSGEDKVKDGRKDFSLTKNLERMKHLDKKLDSLANTRLAEEMDALYQNSPDRKAPIGGTRLEDSGDERRVLSDIREASQEYVAPSKLKGFEEFNLESEYFTSHTEMQSDSADFKYTDFQNYTKINFPSILRPMIFEAGSPLSFPASTKEYGSDLRKYICVNGASIAPVMAMDLRPGVNVLDLCAGPGTKSLMTLMTNCAETLTCNDIEQGRLNRIHRLFNEFTGESKPSNVIFTKYSATNYPPTTKYERVLADVPCLMDRVSLTTADNSIFKSTRIKERLGLVKLQKFALLNAFRCLSKENGSSCVYSTCTLSPIENDGVVGAALNETEIPNLCIDLKGVWEVLLPFKAAGIFNLARTKFGVLIQPSVVSNTGPMYVSRIVVQSGNYFTETE